MAKYSRDYHDYVIRDGKLIGEFEAMYRNSDGVPWHQDEQENWIDVRLTAEMLKDIGSFDEIHDLGCGLGYYLELISRRLGSNTCQSFGYDISATACEKARGVFPGSKFRTLDLTCDPAESLVATNVQPGARRLFIIRGTIWYVFPKLTDVVNAIRKLMSINDQLLVVQNFPPLDRPFVGKDVIPDHSALVQHFSSCFALTRHIWYQDTFKTANDNWFIGLFSVRCV